ncbi:hypothetical protein BLNAU_11389 [Blattamonas nauphoetae]|uniref:K+ Transporter n=1 Tax=Blattamonas nauphoetae TaxID=2049346 RepID=A0ABQ9X3M1_9EUKA|nr:K+ Transporter [Blattamonas nauphoetae]KAK2946282.1 hypothetical protein BLNAU_18803 [Blattamonas nauphoetae]KAK2953587.1 hypothetical protein BLNAU_11451 [Blattamonas nauphoetae]KAK2953668.1 hypothetical protein BLNAU_11389 [Blattamonas nauphoetae]
MPVIVPSETGSRDEAEQSRIRYAIQRHPTSLSSLFIPPPDELSQPAQPPTSSAPKVQPPVSSKPQRHPLPSSSFVATSTITPPPLPPSSSPHPDSRPSSLPSMLTLSPAPSPTFLSRHPVLLAIYRIFQDILAAQRDSTLLRDVSRLDSTSDRLTSLHLLFELSSAYANVGLSVGAFPPLNTAISLSAPLSVSAPLVLALVILLGKHREMSTTIDKSISVSSFDGAADEALKLLPWTDLREMKLTQAGRDRRRRKLSKRKDAKREGVDENEARNESEVVQVEAQVDQDEENHVLNPSGLPRFSELISEMAWSSCVWRGTIELQNVIPAENRVETMNCGGEMKTVVVNKMDTLYERLHTSKMVFDRRHVEQMIVRGLMWLMEKRMEETGH